ncbi:hypothetical protein [Sphingomonas sp. GB1N7]|uniref:hypothetical protein n=1 Tax=Parasphingomonas caseinilytica TaxID=3096158 RepID=UPI002FC85249
MSELRARTAYAHADIDQTFGAYDLTDSREYAQLLLAHARALPVVEALLKSHPELPPIRTRTDALIADLSMLDEPMPCPMLFDEAGNGARG